MPHILQKQIHADKQKNKMPPLHLSARTELGMHHYQRVVGNQALQAKLRIGSANDKYEQEADRVAERVMRMPDHSVKNEYSNGPMGIQRMCSNCEEEEVRRMPQQQEEEESLAFLEASNDDRYVRRKENNASDSGLTPLSRSALDSSKSNGRMNAGTRNFMEARFGHDFSNVKIHADARADRVARSINARAFTLGQDVWFAKGEYQPDSYRGRTLLAHELTHTIQQRSANHHVQRSTCPSSCEATVAAGRVCQADEVTRDNCAERPAADESNKISHIRVLLGARQVHLFWNGTPRTADGRQQIFSCTPNSDRTPQGWDTVGVKCGANHTSWARYNMAWFTAFRSTGYRVGFHDSQPLGSGYSSHGCVRVSCEVARSINQNSVSDWTSIMVR